VAPGGCILHLYCKGCLNKPAASGQMPHAAVLFIRVPCLLAVIPCHMLPWYSSESYAPSLLCTSFLFSVTCSSFVNQCQLWSCSLLSVNGGALKAREGAMQVGHQYGGLHSHGLLRRVPLHTAGAARDPHRYLPSPLSFVPCPSRMLCCRSLCYEGLCFFIMCHCRACPQKQKHRHFVHSGLPSISAFFSLCGPLRVLPGASCALFCVGDGA
jgi:hypothetical protein